MVDFYYMKLRNQNFNILLMNKKNVTTANKYLESRKFIKSHFKWGYAFFGEATVHGLYNNKSWSWGHGEYISM